MTLRANNHYCGILLGAFLSTFVGAQIVATDVISPANATYYFSDSAVTSFATPTQQASLDSVFLTFEQVQEDLGQNLEDLLSSGATTLQLDTWCQQNATQLAAQQLRAQTLSNVSALETRPYITDVDIPVNASQTMEDFLVARADLANARTQIHNQQIQGLSVLTVQTTQGAAELKLKLQNEALVFQQQNDTACQAQQQRAQVLANESATRPQPLPPPLLIPDNATPLMRSFLSLNDQLMRDQMTLLNQYIGATPAATDAALQQWQQHNADRFQQRQQLQQALATASPLSN